MKTIKIAAYILVAFVVAAFAWKIIKWIGPKDDIVVVTMPQDTTFSPVTESTYRPASTPFEKPKKPTIRIPKNIREKDIEKVIVITKDTNPEDTTAIIFTKDDKVYVDRQAGKVTKVEVIEYRPPILAWDWYPKIGFDGMPLSPVVGLSFLELYGHVHLPVFTLDLYGIGIGLDCRIVGPMNIGVIYHDAWNTNKSIRAMVSWTL